MFKKYSLWQAQWALLSAGQSTVLSSACMRFKVYVYSMEIIWFNFSFITNVPTYIHWRTAMHSVMFWNFGFFQTHLTLIFICLKNKHCTFYLVINLPLWCDTSYTLIPQKESCIYCMAVMKNPVYSPLYCSPQYAKITGQNTSYLFPPVGHESPHWSSARS